MRTGEGAESHVHSASWGTSNNGYTGLARDFDAYSYDNDSFLMIVAAGNNGGGHKAHTVGSPATSKNIISVGASQSSGYDLSNGMYGKDYLVDFSSRGPTADDRIKPDIVAPGAYILSARANNGRVGECDPPGGIDDVNSSLSGITWKWGTSMATPAVAGNALLVRQYFEEGWFPTGRKNTSNSHRPSGALVKAVLLNGAQSLFGAQRGYDFGSILAVAPYDVHQGFGRTNLLSSLPLEDKNTMSIEFVDRKIIRDGEIDTFELDVDLSRKCDDPNISITLVWMDPEGSAGCWKCLINDLDLYATKTGSSTTFYPNGRGSRDTRNNAERIRISVEHGDKVSVKVKAQNLATQSQQYALVSTGCFKSASNESISPTKSPTISPTKHLNPIPVSAPTKSPTKQPTKFPTKSPTSVSTKIPIDGTIVPSLYFSQNPTPATTTYPVVNRTIRTPLSDAEQHVSLLSAFYERLYDLPYLHYFYFSVWFYV